MLAARCDMYWVDHEVDSIVDSSLKRYLEPRGRDLLGKICTRYFAWRTEDSGGEGRPAPSTGSSLSMMSLSVAMVHAHALPVPTRLL